jgi:hypothetical protein
MTWPGIAAVALVVSSTIDAGAQTVYGTLLGRVADTSGAALPGVRLTLRNSDTGFTREMQTDESGYYRAPGLLSGLYSIKGERSGFHTIVREPIRVAALEEVTLDLVLEIAGIQERVVVLGEAPLVQKSNAAVSTTVDGASALALPGREALIRPTTLSPGVALNRFGTVGEDPTGLGSPIVVNGSSTRSTNFNIDGVNNTDALVGTPMSNVFHLALADVAVVTHNFPAEFGRTAGAYVNITTRSGSNELHGAVDWTWSGNQLNALNTFQRRAARELTAQGVSSDQARERARNPVNAHSGGFALGGPLKRERTFFFVSADYARSRSPVTSTVRPALTEASLEILRDHAAQLAPGVVGFIERNFPVANQPLSFGSVRVPGLSGPLVFENYNQALADDVESRTDLRRALLRLDHSLGPRDNLFLRYMIDRQAQPRLHGSGVGSPNLRGQTVDYTQRRQTVVLSHTHTFSSDVVNEARLSYAKIQTAHKPHPDLLANGLFSVLGTSAFTLGANFQPRSRDDDAFHWVDNVSVVRGRHTLKIGFDVRRALVRSLAPDIGEGRVVYPSVAAFLFDQNAVYDRVAGDQYIEPSTWELGAFVQDDLKLDQHVTLNLGVRYEYDNAPYGFFSNAKPDIDNVMPRLGLTWAPRDAWVLRGGYGLHYDSLVQNGQVFLSKNYPNTVTVQQIASGRGWFDIRNRPANVTLGDFGGDPNLLPRMELFTGQRVELGRFHHLSLNVQRQLGRDWAASVGYVGNLGRGLLRYNETNPGFLPPLGDANRRDPTRGSVVVGMASGRSNYHAVQAFLRKRMRSRFAIGLHYTYSSHRNTTDDQSPFVIWYSGGLPSDVRNPEADYGPSFWSVPHRAVLDLRIKGPALDGRSAVVHHLFGGWMLSGIASAESGRPLVITNGNNALGVLPFALTPSRPIQRPSVNPRGEYPRFTLRDGNGCGTPTDPTAYFIINGANCGIAGDLGRNSLRLKSSSRVDLSLSKRISFGKRSLDVRADVYRALNTPEYPIPFIEVMTNTTNAATFLNYDFLLGFTREIEFTLRYSF